MSTRLLAFALLASASAAVAAPPQHDPAAAQPATTIDVDALARSKDVGSAAPASEDAPTPAAQDLAQPPAMSEHPAQPVEAAPPPAESPPPEAPVAEAPSAEPPAEMVAEPATSATAAAPAGAAESTATDTTAVTTRAPAAAATPSESSEKISIAASCQSRASSLLDQAQKADFANVTRDFDAKMRTDMPAQKFKQQWESLNQFGKLVARGQSHLGSGQGYTLVMIPLIFEKTNLVAQIACGSDGLIAGFHVTQAPKPKL